MRIILESLQDADEFARRWVLPVVPPDAHFQFKLKMDDGFFVICQGDVMDSIRVGKQRTVHLSVKDKFGNPARIDGDFVIDTTLVDPAAAAVNVAEDKKSFTVVPTNTVIDVVGEVVVSADADLGEGVKPVSGSYKFVIESGEASAFGFSADAEEDQPAVVVEEPAPAPTPEA